MTVATMIAAAGSLVSGFASYQQSQYQGAVASANAKQARLNADLRVDVANDDLEDIGAENAAIAGKQNARIGASGLASGSPSFDQTRARTKELNLTEHERIIDAAYRDAANFRTQANIFSTEKDAAHSAGKFSLIGGALGAAGAVAGAPPGDTPGGFEPFKTKQNNSNNVGVSPRTLRKPYNFGFGFNTGT